MEKSQINLQMATFIFDNIDQMPKIKLKSQILVHKTKRMKRYRTASLAVSRSKDETALPFELTQLINTNGGQRNKKKLK